MDKPVPVNLIPFRIESWARTNKGCVRDHNEDSFCAREEEGLWAVADGMGGHEGGDWASAKLVEKLDDVVLPEDFDAACDLLTAAVGDANLAILAESRRRGKQMGSTVVVMLVRGIRYAVIWCGDSRAYRLREGDLEQISRDHTQVQEMVDRGIMSAEDAVNHPMGHILSRAVGVRDDAQVDKVTGEIVPGDIYLLCSDGLHGYVEEKEIARLLARGAPEQASQDLVELTLANGAPDNVTVIAVWASEPTMLSFSDR
ncbi:MAG: PP2C family protein-serine/threonine phosphatase [Allosphingosinicella sp.]